MNEKATQNFLWIELTMGRIDQRAPRDEHEREAAFDLLAVATTCLQPTRDECGPLVVTSGYRTPRANQLARGSSSSDHPFGRAIDFRPAASRAITVAQWMVGAGLPFDQLILEHWDGGEPTILHVSHRRHERPRRQILVMKKEWVPHPVTRKPELRYHYPLVKAGAGRDFNLDLDAMRSLV